MRSSPRVHLSLRRVAALGLLGLLGLAVAAFASGRMRYVVTSGVSMQPSYQAGDLVFVAPADRYSVGDVVAYEAGARDRVVVLHRIIGGDAAGFELKGDNNRSVDPARPGADQILGRAVLHVPNVGAVTSSPITRTVAVVALLALMAALIKTPAPKRGGAHGSRRASDRSTTLWKTLIALDVLLLAAVTAAYGLDTRAPEPLRVTTQTSALRYQATAPVSQTYPTGEIVTGDPVFTKLVDTVDVSFRYSTDAPAAEVRGTARLDVELSTSTGWQTTIPLVARSPLVDDRADLTKTLDLAAVQRIADEVATETGVGTGPVDIAVVASTTVTVGDAEPVEGRSTLALQLTRQQLLYIGPELHPSVHGPALVTSNPLELGSPVAPPGRGAETLRLPLLMALLLSCGTTAVVWPTRDGHAAPTARIAAMDIVAADRLTRIRLADRAALVRIASSTGTGIVHGNDGWEGVFTPDVLYWTSETRAAASDERGRADGLPDDDRCACADAERTDTASVPS